MITTKTHFMGIPFTPMNTASLLETIRDYIDRDAPALVNGVNVHGMNIAIKNPTHKQVLQESDVVLCDGYGVKLAAKMKGIDLTHRVTGMDFFPGLLSLAEEKRWSLYAIGDVDEVITAFVNRAQEHHPGLQFVGYRNGFFPFGGEEERMLIEDLKKTKPDLILVGMGNPRQEFWCHKVKQQLGFGVWVTMGATYRWYTGHEKRAPQWMSDNGLEWLGRLISKPKTNFKRYVIGIPAFFFHALLSKNP